MGARRLRRLRLKRGYEHIKSYKENFLLLFMEEVDRRSFLLGSAVALGSSLIGSPRVYGSSDGAWPHLREWDASEVEKYSVWVENLYDVKRNGTSKQKRAKIHQMFKDDEMNLLNDAGFLEEGNVQLSDSDLDLLHWSNHCGSFPKLVFNYYSYRRGLPASTSKIKMERGGDIRYSSGNHAVEVVSSMPFDGDFSDYINRGMNGHKGWYNFVSGNFRTAPFLEDTDSVPIEISRDFLVPGTMVYNANGHCLVTGKVDDSGEVHFLDSHPDRTVTFNQTLSAIPYVKGLKEDASESNLKRAYDGFRAMRFSKVEDGRVRYFTNEEMKEFGFSVEQYETMEEMRSKKEGLGLEVNGRFVKEYPQLVRARLELGNEAPLEFLKLTSQELGHMFRERASFVSEGWNEVLRNGAITFPNDSSNENIYQANGRWEVWSSPSSDIDRKNKYDYLASRLEEMVRGFPDLKGVDYGEFSSKEELVDALIDLKERAFSLEVLHYENSVGEEVPLNMNEVEKRLFDLSFDPNHAPALRWGAPEGSWERGGMRKVNTPLRTGRVLGTLESYDLEEGLRYVSERQNDATSLDVLDNPSEPPFDLIENRLRGLVVGE